jgi:pimeloyl-ACP methyl ester carboxylesterase
MKGRKTLRLTLAVLLCVAGFAVARVTPYREATVMVDAGGCQMVTDIVDKGSDPTSGSVILLHGLAANRKIMSYMARAFAEQNLRVFVADLPGHGRTPGPFSFSRAETCTESFARQLIAGGLIDPARTVLAGHSMGGAIAVRLAAHVPFAGVIAVSPAPMSTKHGIALYLLPFENVPPGSAKTLVISGSWEPQGIRDTARDLITGPAAAIGKYLAIPHATHVSLLFNPRAARASQEWAGQVLGLSANVGPPSLLPLTGSLVGFAALLLLAGPFIRETLGASSASRERQRNVGPPTTHTGEARQIVRPLTEIVLASVVAIAVLHFWKPSLVRLFDGGYFAGFLLIVGALVLTMHYKSTRVLWNTKTSTLLAAALAGLLLDFLVTAWLDATLTEAWLPWFRWARFPFLLVASLPFLTAEELLIGPRFAAGELARTLVALGLRFVAWLALLLAIFVLHSGPILLFLLAPYFALFCILQRAGMNIVRSETRSPTAAALFGAILLAGFCLVIFPVT